MVRWRFEYVRDGAVKFVLVICSGPSLVARNARRSIKLANGNVTRPRVVVYRGGVVYRRKCKEKALVAESE